MAYLAVHSGEALFQLMPQVIHLILLQVQISTAVSQNALVAAGSGLDLLQLTAPALQPHRKVSAHVHDSNKRFCPHQCLEQIRFRQSPILMQQLHNDFTEAVVSL